MSKTIVEGVLKVVDGWQDRCAVQYLTGNAGRLTAPSEAFEGRQGAVQRSKFQRYRLVSSAAPTPFFTFERRWAGRLSNRVQCLCRAALDLLGGVEHSPIKTTLLRPRRVCDATASSRSKLRGDLQHFFRRVADQCMKAAATSIVAWHAHPCGRPGDRAVCSAGRWRNYGQAAHSSRLRRTMERADDTDTTRALAELAQSCATRSAFSGGRCRLQETTGSASLGPGVVRWRPLGRPSLQRPDGALKRMGILEAARRGVPLLLVLMGMSLYSSLHVAARGEPRDRQSSWRDVSAATEQDGVLAMRASVGNSWRPAGVSRTPPPARHM